MVARKLDAKLRDHVASSRNGNLFSSGSDGAFGRPRQSQFSLSRIEIVAQLRRRAVLVILDRNVDLFPMLSHSWTYQALVNDVLGMKMNRVTVEVSPSSLESPLLPADDISARTGTGGRTIAEEAVRSRWTRLLLGEECCESVPASSRGDRSGAQQVRHPLLTPLPRSLTSTSQIQD